MNTVIKVDNLSKKYIIGHQKQERSGIKDISTADMQSDANTDMNTINRQYISMADVAEEKLCLCLPYSLSGVCG